MIQRTNRHHHIKITTVTEAEKYRFIIQSIYFNSIQKDTFWDSDENTDAQKQTQNEIYR